MPDEEDAAYRQLDLALQDALTPVRQFPGEVSVLFSGGVDSSLLAHALAADRTVGLFTIAAAGAEELAVAQRAAELLGIRWASKSLDRRQIERAIDRWGTLLPRPWTPEWEANLTVLLAADLAPAPMVVVGQGADELFLGYDRYRRVSEAERRRQSEDDLARARSVTKGVVGPLVDKIGKSLVAPYLAEPFIRAVRSIPWEAHAPGALTKPVLRSWAARRGLPLAVISRPKRAIQYSTGTHHWFRERAQPVRRPGAR